MVLRAKVAWAGPWMPSLYVVRKKVWKTWPRAGLAGNIGIDATTKIGTETTRDWGQVMVLDPRDEAFAADLLARHMPGKT